MLFLSHIAPLWLHTALLLVPTRELALQTSQVCKELGKHMGVQVSLLLQVMRPARLVARSKCCMKQMLHHVHLTLIKSHSEVDPKARTACVCTWYVVPSKRMVRYVGNGDDRWHQPQGRHHAHVQHGRLTSSSG